MYRLRAKTHFDAAHQVEDYEGECSELHGHTWKVEIFVTGKSLDRKGILVDFKKLKTELNDIIKKLDHTNLNDHEEIGNPTSENLARYLFEDLKGSRKEVELEKVRVWEGETSWCEYYEKERRAETL